MPLITVKEIENALEGLIGDLDRRAVAVGLFELVHVEQSAIEIRNAADELLQLCAALLATKSFVKKTQQEITIEGITILRQSRRYSDCGPLKGGLSQSMKFKTTVPAGNSRNIDRRKNPTIHQRAG